MASSTASHHRNSLATLLYTGCIFVNTGLIGIQEHLPGINIDNWESKHDTQQYPEASVCCITVAPHIESRIKYFISPLLLPPPLSLTHAVLLWHGFQVVLPQLQDP